MARWVRMWVAASGVAALQVGMLPAGVLPVGVVPAAARAQGPTPVGTAAAALGTAVTEARDADALAWNPALLGIQAGDGMRSEPVGSFRALGVSVGRAPGARWARQADRVGLLGRGPAGGGFLRAAAGAFGGPGRGGRADVLWVASASEGLGLFATSHARADGDLGEDGGVVTRSVTSVGGLGIGGPAGKILGVPVRLGGTMKGRWTHLHGRGVVGGEWGEAYRERLIRDVPGASLDLGAVAEPVPSLRMSAVVTDLVRVTLRPLDGPRVRSITADSSGVRESHGPSLDGSDGVDEARAADELYRATVPGTWLRAGVGWDAPLGTVATAVETRLRSGGLDGEVGGSRWSGSYALPAGWWPLRVAAARGSGSSAWSVGWVSRACRFPWAVSVGRERVSRGAPAAISLSASLGARAGSTCTLY